MFFGLTFEKVLVIGVIAALLIGPERLPRYAELLAQFVKRARDFAQGARTRVREEMGDEFDEVDWRKLDPRQYDPRRIIREALLEDTPPPSAPSPAVAAAVAPPRRPPVAYELFSADAPPPFDSEAT
ncbi:Sec-independent protein translocase TatB [Microbacterium album]|uniref:Translocase n=1 Tax=Microbacterium album TaxID=2053191 RepID=A0A917IHG6_9MICO|nr:Sec-independent protein translocase TatB [Microbacterium album]GGH49611.1 translocase [Microbacterium album]